MNVQTALTIVGLVLVAIGIYVPLASSIRKDRAEGQRANQEAVRQAVADSTAPITADRDYWRQRANDFESELRLRGGYKHD